ncbi:c-type cytochrome [Massilia sp. SM-13]|uniref:c-type cytochrome n=1 Tax=Pseudoduganella rhizocola TaxID=3382643 RepID=UPI0038B5F99D
MASNRIRFAMKAVVGALAVLGVAAGALGLAVLYGGWYNVGATRQHFQLVHSVLEKGMHESVRFHARDVTVPPLDAGHVRHGAALYATHCVKCHGAPGTAQDLIGMSMQPVPGPLVDAARRWNEAEMYWITRHGIKMSGMPAWEFHLGEQELWSLVAFLRELPKLTPQAYRAATAGATAASRPAEGGSISGGPGTRAAANTGEAGRGVTLLGDASATPAGTPGGGAIDAERGRVALTQYACQACHMIPGVTGPETYVGPPLGRIAERKFLAGRLPNSAANLARWIRAPQEIDPGTAMPQLGVNERDAKDMAAYLMDPR